jgi:membrane-associated phospholipid phosphatase
MVDVLPGLARSQPRGDMSYQIIGIGLILIGSLHAFFKSNHVETRIVETMQNVFNRKPYLNFFQEIWFFGRTTFTLIILIFLTTINWKAGLTTITVFLVTVGVEQLIKKTFDRVRPFNEQHAIKMLQPLEPDDPSFPSGDTLRIWYLAALVPIFAGNVLPLSLTATILAILVTIGRMVMGVHYLTDITTGAGLGLLGAGTAIWLSSLLNFI